MRMITLILILVSFCLAHDTIPAKVGMVLSADTYICQHMVRGITPIQKFYTVKLQGTSSTKEGREYAERLLFDKNVRILIHHSTNDTIYGDIEYIHQFKTFSVAQTLIQKSMAVCTQESGTLKVLQEHVNQKLPIPTWAINPSPPPPPPLPENEIIIL